MGIYYTIKLHTAREKGIRGGKPNIEKRQGIGDRIKDSE